MFGAIFRFFRAIFYYVTGKVDKANSKLYQNSSVISANYDKIITDKKSRLNTFMDAISGLMVQQGTKEAKLKALTNDITLYERKRQGAALVAKKFVEKYGGDQDKCQADTDYVTAMKDYKDFSSTLAEKHNQATELDGDIQTLMKTIADHKLSALGLQKDLDKIREEKQGTIADVESAKAEKQAADTLNNLGEDRTTEELQRLRDTRQKAMASARMSREMAGIDNKKAEQEYLNAADTNQYDDEFNKLMGFKEQPKNVDQVDTSVVAAPVNVAEKLPEA